MQQFCEHTFEVVEAEEGFYVNEIIHGWGGPYEKREDAEEFARLETKRKEVAKAL